LRRKDDSSDFARLLAQEAGHPPERNSLSKFLFHEIEYRPLGCVVTSVSSVSNKVTDRFFLVLSQFTGTTGRSSRFLRFWDDVSNARGTQPEEIGEVEAAKCIAALVASLIGEEHDLLVPRLQRVPIVASEKGANILG
jgi:hypothetical protein